MSQRVVIDCRELAREGGSLQGSLAVSSLTRVLDTLVDTTGDLSYRVLGRMGPRNRPQLILEVDGELKVRCQRCLDAIDYRVRICSLLEMIRGEEDLTQEEIEDDSRDFLVEKKELDVAELIEDDVILDLPSAPRHDHCTLPDAGSKADRVSPFSVLKALKGAAQ
jgi:uncharacterized protein